MANKKLKTIQFPGLPDTYTVPQVENGANNNVAALDGTGNVKDSAIEVSKVAKTDGSYAGMSVGTAENLISEAGTIIDAQASSQSGDIYPDKANNAKGIVAPPTNLPLLAVT